MDLKVVAASLLLLLFCSEVCSFHHRKREAQEKVQLQEGIPSYWGQFVDTAQDWGNQFTAIEWKEKARELYEKGRDRFNFYTSVFFDQAYHWWHSE